MFELCLEIFQPQNARSVSGMQSVCPWITAPVAHRLLPPGAPDKANPTGTLR